MTSRVVVTGWVGTGTVTDPWRADVDRTGMTGLGVIKLRGHPSTDPDALCLVVIDYPAASRVPTRDPTSTTNRMRDLGQDTDRTQLSIATTAAIATDLGIVAPSRATIGELIVLKHGSLLKPGYDGRFTIRINGHLLHEQQAVGGGAFEADTFTYSNGVLGTVSSGLWTDSFNAHDVVSNEISTDLTTENNSASSVRATTFTQRQYAQADCTLGADFSQIGPMVRATNTDFTGYTFYWRSDSTYKIIEWVGAGDTEIATVATTTTGTRLLRLEVDGSALTGYAIGVQVLTITDPTLTNARVGFASYHSPSVANAKLDNWEGGDLPIPPNPYLVAAGTLSAEASTTALGPVAIPAGTTTNDIMILCVMCNAGTTFSTPTDWTQFGTLINSANQSSNWFWKRHDGSESDPTTTTSVTMSSTIGGYARIWSFRGCITTGTPFEDVTNAGTPTTDTLPQSAAIDTTGIDRLAVCFALIDDDPAFSSGNPPALWSLCDANASSTTGGDALFAAISRVIPTASAVAAVTVGTLPAADYWRTLTLAFIPPTAVTGPAWRRRRPQLIFR